MLVGKSNLTFTEVAKSEGSIGIVTQIISVALIETVDVVANHRS